MKKKGLKLKGKNAKRIPKEKKKKMKVTLKAMQKNRQYDSDMLRDLIAKKLEWAKIEQKKGLKLIEDTKVQLHRVDGIILFINDLITPQEEEV